MACRLLTATRSWQRPALRRSRAASPSRSRSCSKDLGPALRAESALQSVDVILSGPLPLLDSLNQDDVFAILDLSGLITGTHTLQPKVVLPDGIKPAERDTRDGGGRHHARRTAANALRAESTRHAQPTNCHANYHVATHRHGDPGRHRPAHHAYNSRAYCAADGIPIREQNICSDANQ